MAWWIPIIKAVLSNSDNNTANAAANIINSAKKAKTKDK